MVRGSGGLGKTTVLAQWVARLPSDHRPVWLTLDQTVRTRAGFWVRVLGALHRGGVAGDRRRPVDGRDDRLGRAVRRGGGGRDAGPARRTGR